MFEEDWELLVVLDTCRVDALELLSHEFEFLPADVSYRYSAGSTFYLWMQNNFTPKYSNEIANTYHITWNPHSENGLNPVDWLPLS